MPTLQSLSPDQITDAVTEARTRDLPCTLTVWEDGRWVNRHSRVLRISDRRLWLELPPASAGSALHEFTPAEKVGLSFKLKHHKYLCSVVVADIEQMPRDDGDSEPVLSVCYPSRMNRLQRRAYQRVPVPANRIVRASFWPGGREAEPTKPSPDRPVWTGRVTDLSAGGLQLMLPVESLELLDPGYVVGIRVSFGAGSERAVYADAQYRHATPVDEVAPVPGRPDDTPCVLVGFQFVGLGQTREGQESLERISYHVAEFQRILDTDAKAQQRRPSASHARATDAAR